MANDYPFWVAAAKAYSLVKSGYTIHQKWTCQYCHSRQTMEQPNKFYMTGYCEECRRVTDIEKRGCNYLLIASSSNGVSDA